LKNSYLTYQSGYFLHTRYQNHMNRGNTSRHWFFLSEIIGSKFSCKVPLSTMLSLDSPFVTTDKVEYDSDSCTPTLTKNLEVFTNLYRHQKKNVHGFPSSENRNCGSKLSFPLPAVRSNKTAGLSIEKVGSVKSRCW